jgi:hypothetical protein
MTKILRNIRVIGICLLFAGILTSAAQTAGQKTFPSAQAAVAALVDASRTGEKDAILAILGSDAQSIISSGDPVADKAYQDSFLRQYDEKHRLVSSGEHTQILEIGTDDWPLPIPVVQSNGAWFFDAAAGKEELLYRRIGHNELAAIDVCHGVVNAEHDYASDGHDGLPAGLYAQRILSSSGKQDGLFWPAKQGEPQSPLGPLVANASAEGYGGVTPENPAPYHGYFYRIVNKQGPAARGGARSYLQNGEMTGGFALVAYPAEYRNSGVMTFVVNQAGVVYQKDLGDKTTQLAAAIESYDPDKTWTAVK